MELDNGKQKPRAQSFCCKDIKQRRSSQPGVHTAEDLSGFIGPQISVKAQDTHRKVYLKTLLHYL
jgi:hypothetical protein